MFHALHKIDMGACYATQKINLACCFNDMPFVIINLIDGTKDFVGNYEIFVKICNHEKII